MAQQSTDNQFERHDGEVEVVAPVVDRFASAPFDVVEAVRRSATGQGMALQDHPARYEQVPEPPPDLSSFGGLFDGDIDDEDDVLQAEIAAARDNIERGLNGIPDHVKYPHQVIPLDKFFSGLDR